MLTIIQLFINTIKCEWFIIKKAEKGSVELPGLDLKLLLTNIEFIFMPANFIFFKKIIIA